MKNKWWFVLCFFTLLAIWMVTMSGYFWSSSNDEALIREMRLVSKQIPRAYQENLDEVVLKHVPLGTPADVALEVCQKNGFKTTRSKDMKGADYPGFEERIYCSQQKTRWFLIFTEEYRVIIYLKNNQVGAVIGRFFIHSI